jgi:hypothetical protein
LTARHEGSANTLRQAQVLKSRVYPVIFREKSPDKHGFSKPELASAYLQIPHAISPLTARKLLGKVK